MHLAFLGKGKRTRRYNQMYVTHPRLIETEEFSHQQQGQLRLRPRIEDVFAFNILSRGSANVDVVGISYSSRIKSLFKNLLINFVDWLFWPIMASRK